MAIHDKQTLDWDKANTTAVKVQTNSPCVCIINDTSMTKKNTVFEKSNFLQQSSIQPIETWGLSIRFSAKAFMVLKLIEVATVESNFWNE